MVRRALTEADLVRMRLPDRFWEAQLDEVWDGSGLDAPSPRKVCEKYLDALPEMMAAGHGLLLWGDNGRGKTCMAAVIGKEARRQGHTVLFLEAASLKTVVVSNDAFDDDQTVWERALSVDLLILDDLGKGVQDSKGFGERLLDELIRFRAAHAKPIIITTNMNPREQLPEALKKSTAHSLKECVLPVMVQGPDRRKQSADRLRQTILGDP